MLRRNRRRAPIVAIEGVSGAGKSSLARAVVEREGGLLLGEAWRTMHSPPSLNLDGGSLMAVERQLLRREALRARRAERAAGTGRSVWLDTGFLGPILYARAWAALNGESWKLNRLLPNEAAFSPLLAPIHVYLDVPPLELLARSLAAPTDHDPALVARHLAVGLIERQFWINELPSALPGRVISVRGAHAAASLAPRATNWADRARRRGPLDATESRRLWKLLARPTRLPSRLLSVANR